MQTTTLSPNEFTIFDKVYSSHTPVSENLIQFLNRKKEQMFNTVKRLNQNNTPTDKSNRKPRQPRADKFYERTEIWERDEVNWNGDTINPERLYKVLRISRRFDQVTIKDTISGVEHLVSLKSLVLPEPLLTLKSIVPLTSFHTE